MLEELGNDLKKIALVGVGAVTILAEKGGEFAKECIEKGTVTVERGMEMTDSLRAKAEQAAKERKERSTEESLSQMTREERDQLRRKLDELDHLEEELTEAEKEETDEEPPSATCCEDENPKS
ncbi:MAG: hypothetical protein HFE97_02820 [Oscillospiraceae bacterium]|nr:hypothetical protein [Oscillospiraceae bacterium]